MLNVKSVMATLTNMAQIRESAIFGLVVDMSCGQDYTTSRNGMRLAVYSLAIWVNTGHGFAAIIRAFTYSLDNGFPFAGIGAASRITFSILWQNGHLIPT